MLLLLSETCPEKVLPGSMLYLTLIIQHFFDLIKGKRPNEALEIAFVYLSDQRERILYVKKSKKEYLQVKVKDLLGLLCYEEPEKCELSYLLSKDQKDYSMQIISTLVGRKSCRCCRFWKCFKIK